MFFVFISFRIAFYYYLRPFRTRKLHGNVLERSGFVDLSVHVVHQAIRSRHFPAATGPLRKRHARC